MSDAYHPDPRHTALGERFFDVVEPATFPQHILRYRNRRWARRLGLDDLSEEQWLRHFGQFKPLPGNLPQPLALRYHGHQFRQYNPELGDGRGFLFAQLRDPPTGRLLDLATKGSGRTPWSRGGDGRLTLKGGVREVLASEMLEALGVYTSKGFSLIETGERLWRNDEPSPTRSCVLVRLGHGHIRIGTFQRLLYLRDRDALERLLDYSVNTYWPEADAPTIRERAIGFLRVVTRAVARLGADWITAGFVHGVLNTDNTMITGESFDYGPWRFLPTFDPNFTAAYFDHIRLYAFGRQPEALLWNLYRLADCLLAFAPEDRLVEAMEVFWPSFEAALQVRTLARLGLAQESPELDEQRVDAFYQALRDSSVPFERAFFDMIGGARPERLAASPHADVYAGEHWQAALRQLRAAPRAERLEQALQHPYFAQSQPTTLLIDDVEALWEPIDADDDWRAFDRKLAEISALREAYEPLLGEPQALADRQTDRSDEEGS